MMEGLITQRVTPLLKCMVLFLFIFTAKVLTSRPHESQDTRNSIHHQKPAHYVRTFTKYHHRRTIQWNNLQDATYWPMTQDQPKVIDKRSVDNLDELTSDEDKDFNELASASVRENIIGNEKKSISSGKEEQNGLNNEVRRYKMKASPVVTEKPTTRNPNARSCLYKLHSVALSVTPSYKDAKNEQWVVENEIFDTGTLYETTMPNGETVQVEQCTDPKAYCYTLWHQDPEGNITVLGQGCWRSSIAEGRNSCDKCTRVTQQLPGSKFCCCTKSFCNADFNVLASLKEETGTMKAESTMESATYPNYSNIVASAILALVAILLMAIVFRKVYCKRMELDKNDLSDSADVEKGDVMGTGPDALATGLLCVDNLTLVEHIGQGKFGSVWRGNLGSTPVAVKLYSNPSAWHKEASIYTIPHLAHPNILRYYGSDTRAALSGARRRLLVLELCTESLRARLCRAPLSAREFAELAHGLAAALAHLHTHTPTKPCIVHRDVNSGNVLVAGDGTARLADLGLAQALLPARDHTTPSRITEAGTLRYLSPEALEGALDLSGARAALCAVDVFALALVLWEMLWRCAAAHAPPAPPPPYAPPYAHCGLPPSPTLAQMQALVSRNKARPPLPRGGGAGGGRLLRLAADTVDECWDHDAEARLTAVCVEERMAELKMLVQAQGPVIHDNNLHPQPPATSEPSPPPETDKNSNCTSAQSSDVSSPLLPPLSPLYPLPHIGRNACIERNTNTETQTHTVEIIHKSIKDTMEQRSSEDNCLSVARVPHRPQLRENSDRLNEIRSYQRPIDYVPNDVTAHEDRGPKQTNLLQDKPKWGIRKFFEKKLNKAKETEVKLDSNLAQNTKTRTSLIDKPSNITFDRPTNLVLNDERAYNFEGPCTLSPPNKTLSPTMIMESEMFKELPSREDDRNQIFAVIVPKVKQEQKGSSESLKRVRTSTSSQSLFRNSESEDSTIKKRLSCDNKIISNSGRSSRASINLELQYIDNQNDFESPFDLNSDCSSSEDEHLMLLSENGGSKITMHAVPKNEEKKKNDVLKEACLPKTDFSFNKYNKYTNFDNEFSDPNDKENLVNGYSGDNPVYLAALNGEIPELTLKLPSSSANTEPDIKPCLKSLSIKRQHSLEQVSDIFSSGDSNLLNPAGRVKTPGDLPVAVRRARRDRALQKGRASECNRLSLYDDRMMFGNSL